MRKAKWSMRRRLLDTGWVKLTRGTLADHILPSYLHQTLTKYNVDCVIDVGANHGQFATMLRTQIDFRGHVISFEAGAATYDLLTTHVSNIFDIDIHHCAIGSENGEMDLNVMEMDVLNSFYTPRSTDIDISPNRVVKTETVPVRRLDTIAEENPALRDAKRIFLKTDTQGFDLEVIAGAEGLFDRVVGLLVEVPFTRIYEEAPTYDEILETLASKGFHLAAVAPSGVAKDRLIDVDALFINAAFAR